MSAPFLLLALVSGSEPADVSLGSPHSPLPPGAQAALNERLELAGHATGAWQDAEAVRAAGSSWRASFDASGVTFTPALGARVEKPHSLLLSGAELLVGESPVGADPLSGSWTASGARATRQHATFREHASAREQGLELWAQIDSLPARGELVLRYQVAGDFPLASASSDQASYLLPELGGVRIDGVVGIDALGRTVRGELRTEGRRLDFVLPESFVRTAELPLVIDPLLSPVIEFAIPADDLNTDIAYGYFDADYLLVWDLAFSASDRDVYAWRREQDGTPIGFLTGIATSQDDEVEPCVAYNPGTQEYVIAWAREVAPGNFDLYAREVEAVTGALGLAREVVATPNSEREPVLADEYGLPTGDYDLLFGWRAEGDGLYRARLLHPGAGGPYVLDTNQLAGAEAAHLSVTNGNVTGRHLYTWLSGTAPDTYISGQLVNEFGGQIVHSPFLEFLHFGEYSEPHATGDGNDFYIAYRHDFAYAGEDWVAVRHLRWDGVSDLELVDPMKYVTANSGNYLRPNAQVVGNQILVTFEQVGFLGLTTLNYAALDSNTLVACEPPSAISNTDDYISYFASLAYNLGDEALITFVGWDVATLEGNVHVVPFQSSTNSLDVLDLGGGTPNGGVCYTPCATVGNAGFQIRLHDSQFATNSYLVLGAQPLGLACGSGLMIADPFSSTVFPGTLEASEKFVSIPIPNEPGLQGTVLIAQWATIVSSATADCPLFSANLSNAVQFSIR